MARAIEGGPSALNAFLYGEAHPSVNQYIQQASQYAHSVVTDAGRAFMDSATTLYDTIVNHDAYRLARAAMRKVQNYGINEQIHALTTIGQLQNAPTVMLPWIMVEPGLRAMYHQGRCEGYGEEYADPEPGKSGQECMLFRAVMHSMVVDPGDVEASTCEDLQAEPNWGCWNYFEDGVTAADLKFHNQCDILDTHDAIRLARQGPDDCTSRWNASW